MKFTKMHVLGNDTVIMNFLEDEVGDPSELARKVCRRNFGIGADTLTLVLPSEKADFRMRLFNSDGSEAEFGGNELINFAKYVCDKGLSDKKKIEIETLAGINTAEILGSEVKVRVGRPSFRKEDIPMKGKGSAIGVSLESEEGKEKVTALSVGNPHVVLFVDSFGFSIEKRGRVIQESGLFPDGVNVQFVQLINENEIAAQQWERGAGITLATGTGAAAAFAAAVINDKCKRGDVIVHFIGGDMKAEWKKGDAICVTGKPIFICDGTFSENLCDF